MDYKATLNLPKTAFPMKASLPQTEPQMLAWWEQIGIDKRLREVSAERPLWILHDGPPYANGNIHMGHVLNKVLKDIVVKSRTMLGFNAVYVPGFDCHGLPIEHQVDKELGLDQPGVDVRRAMDPVEKIRRCRAYAQKYVDIQSEEFQRLGVFGDWEHPYLTMSPAYEGVIAREFARLVGRGLVYKGLKPVHWCMYCKTALAQAEVEYEEQRTPSVYVKFPLVAPLPAAAGAPASLVIWTTTPWTLPANLAIAVHPTEEYVALRAGNDVLIVAAKLADEFVRTAKLTGTQVVGRMPGRALDGLEYRHPWIERNGKVAVADFVAMDTGTGLVHVAPGHGEEDYDLGRALGLRIYNPVDDDGRFVREVAHFAGMTVWEANPKIVEHLRRIGALVAEVTLTHTYPHCWRCKNPTLFRATEQWFVALDRQGLRARTLDAIRRDVRWIPTWGEERIFNMVAHRPDWTLSRQRVWGVPIVAFYCAGCDALLLEQSVVDHVARLFGEGRGIEEWYLRSESDLLPPGTRCATCGGNAFTPDESIAKYGAEVLRLWVAAEDYTEDIRLSTEIIDRLADAYRRIRNTYRFLLGNLADFDPARDRQPSARLDEVDRWILDRLARLVDRVVRGYEEYQFHAVFHSVHNFCAVDLSAQYLDIVKDRLYTSAANDPRRRAAQTTCHDVLLALVRLMAPILTFTAEEAWRYVPGAHGESVHLERFPEVPLSWLDDRLKAAWDRLLEVRREVSKALEAARARKLIGSGLEASVRIASAPEDIPTLLAAKRELLQTLFIVSRVELRGAANGAVVYESQEIPGLVVVVDHAPGKKCERCWTWSERVGDDAQHPALCERCVPVVRGEPEPRG